MSGYARTVSLADIPRDVLDEIERRALEEVRAGVDRVSVRKLLEQVRADGQGTISVNNNAAPVISDYLVARHPVLGTLSERRARGEGRKRKEPQVVPPPPTAVVAALEHVVQVVEQLDPRGEAILEVRVGGRIYRRSLTNTLRPPRDAYAEEVRAEAEALAARVLAGVELDRAVEEDGGFDA